MSDIIIFVIFSGIAVSYGWGMRGTIIGGEKGAMLPGALMGLFMALFSGSEVLSSSPWILAGAGALTMYCGGCMTYGETLHLSMGEKNSPTLKKGLIALFIKGGLWFGLFGGLISLFIKAISGQFKIWQIILFFCLLPVFALTFYLIFNKPLNPEENRFPKIYFSIKRQESWGGLLGILIEIILFALIAKDWSCLAMILGSFISGSVGWVIAQIMQIKGKYPNKKGKHLFDKLYKKNALETWKLMECTLGAFGGIGCAITFILARPLFTEKLSLIDANGLHSYISESKITFLLTVLYLVILSADYIQYIIKPKDTAAYKKYKKLCNDTEFAVYSIIPLLLGMLGAHRIIEIVAVPVILHVLSQELLEKEIKMKKADILDKVLSIIPVSATLIFIYATKKSISVSGMMLIYTFVYEAAYFRMKKIEDNKLSLNNGEKTVHGYFIACCVLLYIISTIL